MNIIQLLMKHGVRAALSLLLMFVLIFYASGWIPLGFIQRFENFTYDTRLNLTMPNTVDDRVVIVDIDEKSLKAEGRWPWSRDKLAVLMNKLFTDYKVHVVGYDVVFAEKDESSGLKNLEALEKGPLNGNAEFSAALAEMKPKLNYDQIFADSIKGRNIVLGYYFAGEETSSVGTLPAPAFIGGSFKGKNIAFEERPSFGANLDILQKNAITAGHFNPDPDADGITRKVSALLKHDDNYYEALSLAVARVAMEVPKLEAGFANEGTGKEYAGLEWLKIGARRIPVDKSVALLIPFRGKEKSFPYISATDVLTGKASKQSLEGRIVLIGATAPGLNDLRAAPVQNIYPGVEMHANVISGILDNNIKERPAYTLGAEVVMLFLVGMLLSLLLPVLSPKWATILTFCTLGAVLIFNLVIWQFANLVLPLATLLILISGIYLLNMSYGFFVESRSKRQLAGLFGQYIPPELVSEMVEKGEDDFSLEGENREMTILFSDVRGFTTISEGLDPKELSQLMNEFLTPMTHVIHHNRGTIDKYMGDAIMAFWGAPMRDNDHAINAMKAAMEMIKSLEDLNDKFKQKGWPELKIGVGLNTGDMTVGNMGSEFRTAYTVMGDTVNLGSRLESLTKSYGVYVIVSEFTKDKVPNYLYRELDIVRVKGKDEPVAIFEPICELGTEDKATKDELKLYKEVLKLFRSQNWDLAEIQLLNLQKMQPTRYLYKMYIERIAHYRETPPPADWDGVYTHETK